MHIKSIASLAIKNLGRSKRRSFLTMLGIIIGVMAVVIVMSVGAGAQSLIVDQVRSQGTDLIGILSGASEEEGPPAQAFGIVITTLTRDDMDALLNKNNIPHADIAAGYISGNDTLKWRDHERNVTYTGSTATFEQIEQADMLYGRFFDELEEAGNDHVMVLGFSIYEEIFGNQEAIGEFVKLKGKNFKIIGVMEPVGASLFQDLDNNVVIPLSVAQNELLGVRHLSFIRLKVDDERYLRDTMDQIKAVLYDRHEDEDFSVRSVADAVKILEDVTNALKFFLVAIAAIALFVGGVGIMNIMLISVKEKTREIGLRKAVGAKKRDIMLQFLIESVFLTMIGGAIGTFLGLLISFGIAKGVQFVGYSYRFIVSFESILISVGVAALVGLIFGLVPARRAAKLEPVDALRYE